MKGIKRKNKNIQKYNKNYFYDVYNNQNKKIKNNFNKKQNLAIQTNFDLNQTINGINNFENEDSSTIDSFDNFCMQTARNKWRAKYNNEKEKDIEIKEKKEIKNIKEAPDNKEKKFCKNIKNKITLHEILEIKDTLKIYKYSDIPRKNPYKLIYQYFYDKFNSGDYEKAHIILFIGKTGDGKTTAINALFNIIKGIQLQDNYRYILIKEQKKSKGQAESQTDGIHLYYIKDYLSNPIIIVDSQGFGDTRGKEYDELIKQAFEYAFKNIIKHINTVCFIAKSTDCRLDITTKYIFSCVTSLFSDDICENLIFFTTFANKSTMREGPSFIKSISGNPEFSSIIKKMSEKWYYVAENLNILDKENDKLTLFSFQQLNDLYWEKIQNSKAKNVNKSYEVITNRNKIQNIAKNIIYLYRNILNEKNKVPDIDEKINDQQYKLDNINIKINNKISEIDNIYIPDIDYHLNLLRTNHDELINRLNNQYEEKRIKKLKYVGGDHTYCNYCESNCHEYCHCIGSLVDRCKIFPIFGNDCEECGHHKSRHTLHSSYKWVYETERYKVDNYDRIEEENNDYYRKCDEINDKYNSQMDEKHNKENELNILKKQKSEIENEKNKYTNEKNKLNSDIKKMLAELKIYCLDLKKISRTIKNIAMNQFHFDIENEYLDTCIKRIDDIGGEKIKEIKGYKEYKKYNDIYLNIVALSDEELIILEDELLNKLKQFI